MNEIAWKELWPAIGPMSYQGWLGKIKVFTIRQSMTKGDSAWYLSTSLPGLTINYRGDINGCKQHAAIVLRKWMKAAGIES